MRKDGSDWVISIIVVLILLTLASYGLYLFVVEYLKIIIGSMK